MNTITEGDNRRNSLEPRSDTRHGTYKLLHCISIIYPRPHLDLDDIAFKLGVAPHEFLELALQIVLFGSTRYTSIGTYSDLNVNYDDLCEGAEIYMGEYGYERDWLSLLEPWFDYIDGGDVDRDQGLTLRFIPTECRRYLNLELRRYNEPDE